MNQKQTNMNRQNKMEWKNSINSRLYQVNFRLPNDEAIERGLNINKQTSLNTNKQT